MLCFEEEMEVYVGTSEKWQLIFFTKRLAVIIAVLNRNDLCEENSFNGYYYLYFSLLLPPLLLFLNVHKYPKITRVAPVQTPFFFLLCILIFEPNTGGGEIFPGKESCVSEHFLHCILE